MAWPSQPQQQEQQQQPNPAMNMNLPRHQQGQQQQHPYPQPANLNNNPQQPFSAYPSYPAGPLQSQIPPSMYNQNYPIPLQTSYPSPYNNNPPFQPYFGLQHIQSAPMISPFQQQPNNTIHHNTQPLTQHFNFKSNDQNTNIMSQTQPLFNHQNNNNAAKQEQEQEQEQEEEKVMSTDDTISKPRLEYSKIALLSHNNDLWVLNGKKALNIDTQTAEENKIFGDIQTVYNEMKDNNSVYVENNTTKQNIRLYLEYKHKEKKEEEETYHGYQLETLSVYDYNIRPYCNTCNEYNRYGLMRIPPVSSYPSTPPINITLHLYSVQFKDLATFTVEDYLTQQIIFDYKTYTKCFENEKEFLTKIIVLRSRVNQLLSIDKASKETRIECITLLDELICIRQTKDALHSQIRALFTTMYMNWRNIQSWRYNDGAQIFCNDSSLLYKGSGLMLYLKKMEPNKGEQEVEYNQAVIDEVLESQMLVELRNSVDDNDSARFEEESVRQSIIQRQNAHLMAPGTVYYIAYIDRDACSISPTSLCNTKERFRRRQLSAYSIYANIFVNNDKKRMKITSTNCINVDFANFECNIEFELEMKLLEKPISIEIEWRTNAWCSSKQMTSIEIAINNRNGNGEWIQYEDRFDSNIMIAPNRYMTKDEYGTYIEAANGEYKRHISGAICYGIKIDITDEYHVQNESVNVNTLLSVHVMEEKEKEKENEINGEFLLIDIDDENEDNMATFRQKILQLRERYAIGEHESVPLFDVDIPDHLYSAVHDETKQEIAYRNEMILDRMNNAIIDVSEVVREDVIDVLPCFSFSIYSLFTRGRRLRPKRSYFDSKLTAINPDKCRIIIQIVESRNLAIRKTDNLLSHHHHHNMNMNMNMVQPFIEICFMGNKCRTFTSFGANARWEETLYIEFIPPGNHKYTPSNMQKINADVEIAVYDEWIISKLNDDRATNSQIQRKEQRYLGSIKIPFSTIYLNQSIEGVFQLNVPLILLGYNQCNKQQQTSISLFATLDPPIIHTNNKSIHSYYEWVLNHNKSQQNTATDFFRYCMEWTQSIWNNRRFMEIFSSNSRNEPELVCRYLRSVEPPMHIPPEIFIRFVSCIPYKEDLHLIPGARDVWMTNTDFIHFGCGDGEEHCNLLASYFLWLDEQNPNSGWCTFIAMGHDTMFVLRRKASAKHCGGVSIQNVMLYDASNGLSYVLPQKEGNNNLNLMHIAIVYNSQQIYGNLQWEIDASSDAFNWEFENKQCWKPLFNDNKWQSDEYCLPSLQEARLEYISSPNEYYMKRQNKLEYIIEKAFDEWRDLPTKWNYAICKTLREILVRLEPLCQNGGNIPIINQDPQIFAINQIYSNMYGFPLNVKDNGCDNLMLESDENKAVSLVYSTKVHENDDPNVEFARAVYIYPYTNKVASVWIYIASLSKD